MSKIETALETIGHHLACARDGDSRREIEDAIDTLVRELGDLELMRRRMDQLHLTVAAQQVQIDGMQKILIGQVVESEKPSKADLITVLRELRDTAQETVKQSIHPNHNPSLFHVLPKWWQNLIGAIETATFVLGDKMAQQPATPRREPIDVQALFEQYYGDEHGRFDRVVNPLHPRPDIAAMILLDRLVPDPGRKMISSAGHKQVMWLNISPEELVAATKDEILTLVRCGVVFDREFGGLVMYV